MDDALCDFVWQRARDRCEYCGLQAEHSILPFQIDHIIARKHGGKTIRSNLALACYYDNSFKGSDISSVDPASGKLCRLFNPRRHVWSRHFKWDDAVLVGRTAIGRTTIALLQMNLSPRVEQRAVLIAAGLFPDENV